MEKPKRPLGLRKPKIKNLKNFQKSKKFEKLKNNAMKEIASTGGKVMGSIASKGAIGAASAGSTVGGEMGSMFKELGSKKNKK